MGESYQSLVGRHGSIRAAARALDMNYSTFHGKLTREKLDPAILNVMDAERSKLVPANIWKRGVDADGNKYTTHLKPNAATETREEIIEGIKAGLADTPKSEPLPKPTGLNEDLCTYYPIVDQHHGLLTWGEEVGVDWDSSLSAGRLYSAVSELVDAAPKSERGVILNMGDFTHQNDQTNATPQSKHQLDVDSRHFKIMRGAVALLKQCIELLKAKHENVVYRGLRGNHDEAAHIAITLALAEYYSNDDRVHIEVNPNDFYAEEWGVNMVMAHHGDKAKADRLVMFAADEYAEIWGRTKYRFCWTGHIHHKSAKDTGGMLFESFRTLAPRDAYAHSHAFSSRQSMTAITLHREQGERVRNQVNY